jgi:hypothetical protein
MPAIPPAPITAPMTDPTGTVSYVWSRYFTSQQQTILLDVAPANARYLTVTANPSLTAEENLGALAAGYLKQTVAGGVASVTTTATIPASDLSGVLGALDGSLLTNLNADALQSGTVPDGRFPATLPTASGANLTNLDADALTSGTVLLDYGGTGADLSATGGASQVLQQSSSGAALTVGQLASTDLSDVVSGVYTPTLTNVANLDASTAYSCQYVRVGSVVTVSGQVDVDPTAAAATQLGLSLPIASNFANANECAGTAFASGIAGQGAAIRGDATNNRAELVWIAGDLTNQPMFFSFIYRVI